MSISEPFVRRPIATSLLMGGIFLLGCVVYPLLPVAPLPQVDFPTLQVTAQLPGASPETMAATVATPLEYQFAEISGLTQMTSVNILGTSLITLQFDLNRNIDAAAQDVQTGIDAAGGQLPKNLPTPPTYRKVNPADSPILMLGVHSDVLPVTTVDDYAENILAQQISQIPGIAQVSIGGQQKPAVRVQIDPVKLAALGLQMEDVAGVIAAATVDAPKGAINGPARSLTIYDNDQLLKAAPWNDVVVAYKNGAPVRIRDIGVAVDGPENNLLTGFQNGRNGILLLIFKQPGANVIDAEQRVEKLLPHALASVPPSVKVDIVANRTTTIKAAVEDVEFTLVLTIGLVVLVIFLFLRTAWATIIPGVTVPLALLGTAAVMYVLNYSLDNLSLMALTIAVGFVVDDAIVMLENVHRHIEDGLTPLEATLKGAGEIGFTIMSISVSLVAVFIPLLLMGGIIGRLFREFAITMTLTIAVSAFVALTLSPTMCALFLKDEKHAKHGRFYMAMEHAFDKMLAWYTRGLDFVLARRRATLVVFLLTVATTVLLYVAIPKGFFPQQDTGIITGLSDAPQDISFEEMVRRQHALLDVVARDPGVESYGTIIGGNRPINNDFTIIGLKPRSERDASADEILTRLRPQLAKIPGATLFMQAAQDLNIGGRTSRTQYQYTLTDANIDELNDWAPKLLERLQKLPMLRDVASDQQTTSGMVSLTIDRDQAARFGIQPAAVDQALYDAFGQRQAAQFFTQQNSYHVVLEITPSLQRDPDSLHKLYLKSPLTGQMVPLSAMTRYDTEHVTYLSINHQGQFPAVTLSFNLAPGAALGDAVDAITKISADMHLPATITGTFQGTAQAFQSSLKTQPYLILAALVAVYIILGMLYESYIHPLTILSTLPSAGVGALLILLIFHIELNVMGLIGIILLIGIVKKNGIMMVDFAIQAEREQHLSPRDSIRQACLLRFRPIMMTTMAALLGAVPLALGHGTGSELRRPLGYTMVGGLIVSQALTLFTTPVIYLYLDELSLWFKSRRKRGPMQRLHDDTGHESGEPPHGGPRPGEAPGGGTGSGASEAPPLGTARPLGDTP
jgi:hydrophobic/amphiphilic exporter-1 (mainly G- bacteria), HAE1 family